MGLRSCFPCSPPRQHRPRGRQPRAWRPPLPPPQSESLSMRVRVLPAQKQFAASKGLTKQPNCSGEIWQKLSLCLKILQCLDYRKQTDKRGQSQNTGCRDHQACSIQSYRALQLRESRSRPVCSPLYTPHSARCPLAWVEWRSQFCQDFLFCLPPPPHPRLPTWRTFCQPLVPRTSPSLRVHTPEARRQGQSVLGPVMPSSAESSHPIRLRREAGFFSQTGKWWAVV